MGTNKENAQRLWRYIEKQKKKFVRTRQKYLKNHLGMKKGEIVGAVRTLHNEGKIEPWVEGTWIITQKYWKNIKKKEEKKV